MKRDLQEETARMLHGASQKLAEFVAHSACEFWQRKDFRLYVDFGNISQTEQDRMFNELEVSILGLFEFHLDDGLSSPDKAKRIVLKTLQKEIPESFIDLMEEKGVEKKYTAIWRQLIDMRLEEYSKDFKIALRESRKMKEFEKREVDLRIAWARIETITTDCLTHIRRGNVEEKDPLWRLLRKWFITLDTQIHPLTQLSV